MKIITDLDSLRQWRESCQKKKLALIPTMGNLHAGHLKLVEEARRVADLSMVSIYVNPLQFGAGEDFRNYPRTLSRDLELCRQEKVEAVFIPEESLLFPSGRQNITKVQPAPSLENCLCGKSRPGHFVGVLTILIKLFNLIKPTVAIFGEKDYQQLKLVQKMVYDFDLELAIKAVETVRDEDGLALSSRNQYLSPSERIQALEISRTLQIARDRLLGGEELAKVMQDLHQPWFEYFEARDPENLQSINDKPLRLLIAAKIGKARLIDNISI
ncbi:MAG: pantoate--beta-alanine ligase [Candidatus Caenarcaniphilales bacterium]|nr:pantoate--beta-alanine ligase [Candidatus Caenarcaniphilales bacterium]